MELTKAMLTEDTAKKAKLLLDVLERRDEHYAKKEPGKKVEISKEGDTEDKPFKIVVEGI